MRGSQSFAKTGTFSINDCYICVRTSSPVLRLQTQCDVCLVETLSPPRWARDPHGKVYCCRLFALLYARLSNAILSLCSVLPSTHKHTTCSTYSTCLVRQTPHLQALFYNPRPCKDVSSAFTCTLAHSEQLERGKLVPWAVWFGIREIRIGWCADPLRWGVMHCGRYLHGDDAHHLSLLGDG